MKPLQPGRPWDGYGNGYVGFRQLARDLGLIAALLGIGKVLVNAGELLNQERWDHQAILTLQSALATHHDEFRADQLGETTRVQADLEPLRQAVDNLRVEVRDIRLRLDASVHLRGIP